MLTERTRIPGVSMARYVWLCLWAAACGRGGAPSAAPGLVVNEYSTYYGDFVELYNAGSVAFDLRGTELRATAIVTDDSGRVATDTAEPRSHVITEPFSLPPGLFYVVWEPLLDDDGGTLELVAPNGTSLETVTWADNEAHPSRGRYPDGAADWRTFAVPTPGTANRSDAPGDAPSPYDVALNEVVAGGDNFDPVEILSLAADEIDLTGFWYIDSSNNADNERFVFAGVTLAPGEFLVLEDHTFGLREEGDAVYLYDPENRLVDTLAWDAAQANISFCRVPDGTGEGRACSAATLGGPNTL